LGDLGAARLASLGDALGLTELQSQGALAMFRLVSDPWGRLPVGEAPAWKNDLTDDGTPFEFSVGFEGGRPELRMLFESQLEQEPHTQHASWQAGIDLQARLRARGLCNSERFEKIADLFVPRPEYVPRFALWHAVVLRESGPSLLKAYVNPEVSGVAASRGIAAQAFARLQMERSWDFVAQKLNSDTRIPYISLDLESGSAARAKAYLTATHADEVAALTSGSSNDPKHHARDWLNRLLDHEGPYTSRPVLVCYSFVGAERVPASTVHVPIRSYVPNDQVALQRTLDLLPARSARQLGQALEALATPSLGRSRGVLTYVSLRFVAGSVRVTTYLAPRAYALTDQVGGGTIPTGHPSAHPEAGE
jgi:DMATS type aromatic prenyltransferase